MPTTAPWIVENALATLMDSRTEFAVLHGEDNLSRAESDVDIVASVPAGRLVTLLLDQPRDYFIAMLWPYDTGGSASLFLVTPDLSEGAQIDVLFDPRGVGRLGLKSVELLKHTTPGRRFPRLTEEAELLYLLRKRAVKAQWDRVADLLGSGAEPDSLRSLANRICSPAASKGLTVVLAGGTHPPVESRLTPGRALGRVRRPIGAWIHWDSDDGRDIARELDHRASRIFPYHRLEEMPDRRTTAWWMRRVQPVRLKAGIVSSWGGTRRGPSPDLTAQEAHFVPVAEFLERRLVRRLQA